ncbi:ABC transporter family substrate-binding protein, partial [Actinomycetaceae bacterium TAE3-ERU4]|nr:ABC transporter family substrate-binding protein [Actinomycetaceae bacterium TAE3-ERU4]
KPSDYLEASYDELKDGGELTLAISEIPEQMNPWHGDSTADTTDVWTWYNPRIALYDKDAKWYADPNYITSVKDEVKDGKTIVTWDINPKATFNDGTPIDYRAFQAAWMAARGTDKNYIPSDTDGYSDMESVEKGKDDKQVVVTYKFQYPWWKKNFEFLLHPAVKDAKTFNEAYLNNPHPEWGAGPYTIDTIDTKANVVVFKKNDKWWGKPGKLDKVTLKALSAEASINAFKNNTLDATGIGTKDRLAQINTLKNISTYTSVYPGLVLMQINSKSAVGSDKAVREATFHAINRPKLVEIRFNGMNYKENPVGSLTLKPFQEGYEDNIGEVGKFDQEKANKLLDEAGWKKDGDYRVKDGKKLELHIPSFSQSETTKALYGAMQKMLKDVGINLIIDQKKPTDFASTMKNKDFD